jgi:hypothetical protein
MYSTVGRPLSSSNGGAMAAAPNDQRHWNDPEGLLQKRATISHRVPERELEANVTQTSIKIPQVDFD